VPFFDRRRPRVYAHRGGSALGPENTVAAFDIGLAAGADGLELDVRLSSDGIPVVVHDSTLDRTTDATGPVSAKSAAELARVDAGCRFTDAGGTPFAGRGIGVPALVDVLRRYPGVPTIIELKVDTEDCGVRVAQVVCAADAAGRVCLGGFGLRSALGARQALPSAGASACQKEVRRALHCSWIGWPLRRLPYHGYQVPERSGWLRVVSPRFIRQAHKAGLAVEVWTVDERPDMERLLGMGVDGLISNRPDLAVAVRDGFLRARSGRS
jgi:glycerophosphoryl diester phosphodiesterase